MPQHSEIIASQLEESNKALLGLSVNVTAEDRTAAKKLFSEFTIIQYLKGSGKNLDTSIKLLKFFRVRISDRKRFINDIKNI